MTTKNTTHLAGEFLVAGELSRRGYPVSITMGNAKSVDIYAESMKGVVKIDAKAGRICLGVPGRGVIEALTFKNDRLSKDITKTKSQPC